MFIVPSNQFAPSAAHVLRQLLLDSGVEVHRALETFRVDDIVTRLARI